ncbi:hypothetical protein [Nocardia wallacei]|uniref:hypothetical protein n=1 Tax=Nocardia wallacei TaxID=480035 RepID=UPI002455A753|nr:hypothetical protein [Nocardia wallacei]
MIAMSFIATMITGFDGVEAEYVPARQNVDGEMVPAFVRIRLVGVPESKATLTVTVEDARTIAEALPQILMLHDATVRLAADCAVDEAVSAAVDGAGKAA